MGEWTWLHARFPLADVELTKPPMEAKISNVLVRTIREVPAPDTSAQATHGESRYYMLRVAPHNVAPFRGGPWTRVFAEAELTAPGAALADFREKLAKAVASVYPDSANR